MASLLPVALYGLKVPAGDVMVPALSNVKSTVSVNVYTDSKRDLCLFPQQL